MRALRTLLAVSAVVVLAAACTSPGGTDDATGTASPAQTLSAGDTDGATEDTTEDSTEDVDLVGAWVLASATTADGALGLIPESPVSLDVTEDLQVSGQSACNRYAGAVEVAGPAVTFGPLASTLMACEEPVMAVEAAYLAALGAVEEGVRSADTLTLTGPDTELTFELQVVEG